jgi:hypothetical protein
MLDRDQVINKAYIECMAEMYAKAQPSADYYQLLEDAKNGKIDKDEKVYERHYLSYEEFIHIRDKYVKAYGLQETWKSNIEVLEDYLINGGTKDKYIESRTDALGHYHPGYRGYEKVAPIATQIQEILKTEIGEGNVADKISNKITETVLNTITNCKEFYRFDREEADFNCSVALGASPTSNKETVIEYWKSQGKDIEIIEPNPLLIWERDYYGDEFEEVMEYEYGEDWKEQFDNKWEEEKRKKEEEKSEWRRKYEEMLNNKSKDVNE